MKALIVGLRISLPCRFIFSNERDSLTFEKAATFPLGASTVAQGLFQQALKMELPSEGKGGNGQNVLIYVRANPASPKA